MTRYRVRKQLTASVNKVAPMYCAQSPIFVRIKFYRFLFTRSSIYKITEIIRSLFEIEFESLVLYLYRINFRRYSLREN